MIKTDKGYEWTAKVIAVADRQYVEQIVVTIQIEEVDRQVVFCCPYFWGKDARFDTRHVYRVGDTITFVTPTLDWSRVPKEITYWEDGSDERYP